MNILKPQTAKIAPSDSSTGSCNNNNNNNKNLKKDSFSPMSPSTQSLTKDDETLEELFQKARNNSINDDTSFDLGSTNFLYSMGSTRKGKMEDTAGDISSGVDSAVRINDVTSAGAGIVTDVTSAAAGIVSDVTVPVSNNNNNNNISNEEKSTTNSNNNNDNSNNNSFSIKGEARTIIHKDISEIIDEFISPKSDLHVKHRKKNNSNNKLTLNNITLPDPEIIHMFDDDTSLVLSYSFMGGKSDNVVERLEVFRVGRTFCEEIL